MRCVRLREQHRKSTNTYFRIKEAQERWNGITVFLLRGVLSFARLFFTDRTVSYMSTQTQAELSLAYLIYSFILLCSHMLVCTAVYAVKEYGRGSLLHCIRCIRRRVKYCMSGCTDGIFDHFQGQITLLSTPGLDFSYLTCPNDMYSCLVSIVEINDTFNLLTCTNFPSDDL